ncbi:oxidoreductase [Methanohalophilus euhalobius]|uniref:Oxidoreductase n=2 Tax=Methanohalophilus euhalobius TaxID=51203 RepID=A0A3M9LHH0_9EURY|nr:oxidoreductase [Methanohalophilus euhalobius]
MHKKEGSMMTQTYDYIIVGAGTSGPVVASRLSEDPQVSVLLLEAGGENTNDISRTPGAFFKVWGTDYDWQYETEPQKGLNNRKIYSPGGHVVGGSSAINMGFWMRGTKEDYDFWEQQGAMGWNFETALEMFQKIEDTDLGPTRYRGKGGKVRLEYSAYPTEFTDTLLNAFKEAGFGDIGDFQAETPYRADIVQKDFINQVRHTPADSYLSKEIRKRPNLTVQTDTFVRKVIFKGNRAVGVEVEHQGKVQQITAGAEIILSAGTYNTAQILKLSGVGPKEELAKHGIPVVADVPGVGENLNDHLLVNVLILSSIPIPDTHFNPVSDESIAQWRKERTGPACYYPGPAAGLISSDKTYTGPDFEIILEYVHNANGSEKEFAGVENIAERSGYSFTVILTVPKSRGNVLLASGDPHDKPLINPNYLSNPDDMKKFIKGIRYAMQLTKTRALLPYTERVHPAPDASDADIETFIHSEASSVFHPVGTARIGDLKKDPMAVVDSHLRVRGVEGLRVADASIMPQVTRGHTMAPVTYIGEMAAQIIRSEKH